MKNINTKKGFTIIEVVLVLAIAGLIFLMVFVALPNMQKSQRDTQRRQDLAALASNIETYITNNGGKLPSAPSGGTVKLSSNTYINQTGTDPNGEYYVIEVTAMASGTTWTENNSPDKKLNGTGVAYLQSTENSATAAAANIKSDGQYQIAKQITQVKDGTYILLVTNANCSGSRTDGAAMPAYDSGNRKFAIYADLETGTYCQAY